MAFVTGAFPTGKKHYSGYDWPIIKRWLAVLHRFDAEGNHLGTETRLGGSDIEGRDVAEEKAFHHLKKLYANLIADDPATFGDVWVRLFSIEIDDVTHELKYEQTEEEPPVAEERDEWVMLEPCDIMFHPPWDSGEYST